MIMATRVDSRRLKVASLFAGVGGIDVGFAQAGHETHFLCEIEPGARAVLAAHFAGCPSASDICDVAELPRDTDLLAAGFPCQDLSQAGQTKGIGGRQSGLVNEVFRLLEARRVPWIFLENVPFMLHLGGGAGIAWLTDNLERLGYRWAYRVIDSHCFGLPQRRQRVFLLASAEEDPAAILLSGESGEPAAGDYRGRACGFYWTEGLRGLGWAVDAVPTLKSGSTIGIPSPPAIWFPDGRILTPDIRDAERLQGFEPDWTLPAETVTRRSHRWKLVGNAVNVTAARWLGSRLARPSVRAEIPCSPLLPGSSWPRAALGESGRRYSARVSTWPMPAHPLPLEGFLQYPGRPLSTKATKGFLSRLRRSSLSYPPEFREALEEHVAKAERCLFPPEVQEPR